MIILDMPSSPAPSELELYIERNQVKLQSFSQLTQIQKNPGDRWVGKVTLPMMTKEQAADWLGFFDALDGYVGQFRMLNPDFENIFGTAANNVGYVNGANQKGNMLLTAGWPASRGNLFKRGDMIEIAGKLKRITADVSSDSSGHAALPIAPALYISPPSAAVVQTQNVGGIFRLSEGFVSPRSDALRRHSVSFAIEEVLL